MQTTATTLNGIENIINHVVELLLFIKVYKETAIWYDVPLSKMGTHGCLNNRLIHSPKLEQVDKGKRRKDHPDKINRLYDSEQTVTLHRTPGWLTSTSIQMIAPHYSGHACANPRL